MPAKSLKTPFQIAYDGLLTRKAPVFQPSSLDEKNRSAEFVASTENPVVMMDWDAGEEVDEVLLTEGVQLPGNKQVPFLDAHNRYSNDDSLGSMREFKTDPAGLVGRAFFSRRKKAQEAFQDVQDGHITDVSVGYRVNEAVFIPKGDSFVFNGKTYKAENRMLKLATKWSLKEVSLVPIGADPAAKVRAEAPNNTESPNKPPAKDGFPGATSADFKGGIRMDKKLFSLLVRRGSIPADATEETALGFLAKLPKEEQDKLRAEAEKPEPSTANQTPTTGTVSTEEAKRMADAAADKARADERSRADGIREACKLADLEGEAEGLIKRGLSVEKAKDELWKKLAERTRPVGGDSRATAGTDEQDKVRSGIVGALAMSSHPSMEKNATAEAQAMRGIGLHQMMRIFLRSKGINPDRMGIAEIVDLSCGFKGHSRGYYTSIIASGVGDFSHLMQESANNILLKMYKEKPPVGLRLARETDVPDFLTNYRTGFSEAPNMGDVNEKGEYPEATFKDTAESFKVTTKGLRFTLSRQALINGRLNAFDRVGPAFSDSARRSVNTAIFTILTTNAALHDGVALFHNGSHLNNPTAAALNVDSFGVGIAAMMKQKGKGTDTAYLEIEPSFIVVPSVLLWTAIMLCGSEASVESGMSSGVMNPYKSRGIQPISHPILDANSATRWYLSADPYAYDTIECAYLEGTGRMPYLVVEDQMDPDGRVWHVRHDFGVKALDHVGLLMNDGA